MGEMKQMNYDIATGVGNSDEKGEKNLVTTSTGKWHDFSVVQNL